MKIKQTCLALAAMAAVPAAADLVAHFPMEVRSGQIMEQVSGERFAVMGNFAPENLPGAVGQALRFDGYTSHVDARLGNVIPAGTTKLTFSAWVAAPCYPIIQIDTDTREQTAIVSCLDETAKKGFGFFIGFDGKYSFRSYVGGWAVDLKVDSPLPVYQWNNLVAVLDCEARTARLYNNGVEVASGKCTGSMQFDGGPFYMGQSNASRLSGPFELMSFNGLVDDVKIWNEALDPETIRSWKAENPANLDIPASRFAEDILRPRFHGMPAAAWTNECHGMVYSAGRYHLFFQKNADGPYMARLHWGHISSENLYDWREEPIAIAPGDPYDIKGCWSGCVFTDDVITGGRPNILYTAVDYAKASIAQAAPESASLNVWTKSSRNPIIPGRPSGLSDDFRDPYFFRNGDNAYIIVGSSKNGVGTTTLHRYQPAAGSWTNDGSLFFTGTTAAQDGTFWEMPNITPMDNGNWLFTVTPLATSTGVRTLYYTGTIDGNGQFKPASVTPGSVELISRDGFGMLSPTIYQHEGKTIALGIVPDKLPSQTNWNLGWAHCYSLPREWSLDAAGNLVQKPWSMLQEMRPATGFDRKDFSLDGTLSLNPASGREVEICATFSVGQTPFGFNIFKNESAAATITYQPRSGELIADFSKLTRLANDDGVYNGVYRCFLPEYIKVGGEIKLNIFIDHSIVDIFVNDRWATSIRVFPTAEDADGIEAFANGPVDVRSLQAWSLNAGSSAVEEIEIDGDGEESALVDVYSIDGSIIRRNVAAADARTGLRPGLYIIGTEKVLIR